MDDFRLLNSATQEFYGDFNDISFVNSDIELVNGHAKAQQDVTKILLTQQGSNSLFPGYGSTLPTIPNTRSTNTQLNANIQNTVLTALAYLATVDESTVPSELPASVNAMNVQYRTNNAGQNGYLVSMVVMLQDGTPLQINLTT